MATSASARADLETTGVTSAESIEERILEAALAQFGEVGIRKSTIEDIARRAGIDRVTVYRRIGSRDDVVKGVLAREATKVIADLAAISAKRDNLADQVADAFTTILQRAQSHVIFSRLLSLEPEFALPRLTTDGQSLVAMSVFAAMQTLLQAVDQGLLEPAQDLEIRAEIIVRVVHSFVMTPHATLPMDTPEQMGDFARTYLVPIIRGY